MNAARLDALVRYLRETEHLPKPWYRRLMRWWAMRQIDKRPRHRDATYPRRSDRG
jgi:hypothetical protein